MKRLGNLTWQDRSPQGLIQSEPLGRKPAREHIDIDGQKNQRQIFTFTEAGEVLPVRIHIQREHLL